MLNNIPISFIHLLNDTNGNSDQRILMPQYINHIKIKAFFLNTALHCISLFDKTNTLKTMSINNMFLSTGLPSRYCSSLANVRGVPLIQKEIGRAAE
jgi:hypothetical protein